MKVVIVGAGIGGLATALSLHEIGIDAELYEQARELKELGVGINMLPHAIKELSALGLLPALDAAGIRTRELIYANRFGQTVWQELRGLDAGYDTPQISIHRGKLHGVLLRAAIERLGPVRIHTDCRLVDFQERAGRVVAILERRDGSERIEAAGDALIGADGIHSRVRSLLYPDKGRPTWNGHMLWRGATEWPAYADGRTMVIAGGNSAKFVFYPIHADPSRPRSRLTNWAVMARVSDGSQPPPRREDWNRPGNFDEAMVFVRDRIRLGFVDPVKLIEATGTFYEYPCSDRDPLPRWSFGRVTLLGDAAHPMYPRGSNGAGQSIIDARYLTGQIKKLGATEQALQHYEAVRGPATANVVLANRNNPPDAILREVWQRSGGQRFERIEDVISATELQAISDRYKKVAGFDRESLRTRPSFV